MKQHFLIRFNKSRGMPGRGSPDHVWRVFADDQEYLCKHVKINVPCHDEKTDDDWNIACDGYMRVEADSTIVIDSKKK